MRKVVLQEFVSLDGLAAGEDNTVDFIPASTRGDSAFGRAQLEMIDTIDTMLLGRTTYEMFSRYWPTVTEGDDKPIADRLNAIPKVVFSNTLDHAPWGSFEPAKIVRRNATQEVAKMKRQDGRSMIVWGSLSVAQALMDENLIDEYRLVFCPVVLGGGRPLFRENGSVGLTLITTTSYERGAVQLIYTPGAARSHDTRHQAQTVNAE